MIAFFYFYELFFIKKIDYFRLPYSTNAPVSLSTFSHNLTPDFSDAPPFTIIRNPLKGH